MGTRSRGNKGEGGSEFAESCGELATWVDAVDSALLGSSDSFIVCVSPLVFNWSKCTEYSRRRASPIADDLVFSGGFVLVAMLGIMGFLGFKVALVGIVEGSRLSLEASEAVSAEWVDAGAAIEFIR